jgi:homoserine O-acetyltransferase
MEDCALLFKSEDFELANGGLLAELEISYECYGQLNDHKTNAIMVSHGITSSHIAAGEQTEDRRRGWYQELIGPGKLMDTDRYCVISSNCLGSCYGSTGPASTNPATGKPYGQEFPEITYSDMVRAQHGLLQELGVEHLTAYVASSIGGFQAFQWAVTFPEFISAIIALDTAPKDTLDFGSGVLGLMDRFSKDPNWNNGDYYSKGSLAETLTEIQMETLRGYGFVDKLEPHLGDAEREAILAEIARDWALEFDPHSLISLTWAGATFNVEDDLGKIVAPILYVLCNTDEWFPASIGKDVMAKLLSAGVDATYHEVDSPLGHFATTEEPDKWVPAAAEFLSRSEKP